MGKWKAMRPAPGKALELYDLSKDVGEQKNVAAANPTVIIKLENLLRTARTKSLHWPIVMPKKEKAQR